MNKKKKTLLIGAVVLVLLIAAMLVLLFTQPKGEEDTSSVDSTTSSESVYLYEEEEGSLKTLEVTNSHGTYTLEKVGEEKWGVPALDDYKVDTEMYEDVADRYTQMSAKEKLLDTVEDKAKYGLDKPGATGVATFENGNTHTVYVGDMTPDEAGYYAMAEGDDALYIITVVNAERLLGSELIYLDLTLLNSFDTEDAESYPTLENFTLERKDLDYKVVLEQQPKQEASDDENNTQMYASSLMMTAPIQCDVDAQRADEEMIMTLFGLEAEEAVALDADSVKEKYGLDDPFAKIHLEYDGRSVDMAFGDKADDESYYMTFGKNNVVYRVKAESVAALTVDPNNLISRLSILPYIDDVSKVKIRFQDKTYEYVLDGEDDDLSVSIDGKTVDTDNFKQLYQLILNPSLNAIYLGEQLSDPAVKITFEYRDGSDPDVVSMYNDGGRQMVFGINGVVNRTGRSAYLDKLEKEIQNLIDGKEVTTDW